MNERDKYIKLNLGIVKFSNSQINNFKFNKTKKMRKLIVTGRLGGDPEVKTTKNGTAYTTFRIANQEYGDENTSWITVTVWDSAQQNFCKNLKKGSSVIIDGDYTDRIYISNKNNQPEIGRDMRSNAIYFGMLPPKEEGEPQPTATTVTPKATSAAPKATTTVAPKTTPVVESAVMPGDDDLPF